MEIEIGKKYTGKNNDGEIFLIQIVKKYPEINRYGFKIIKGNTGSGFEFFGDSIFAKSLKPYEDLPRICYVLGGEDTPLKINEEFKITDRVATYRIAEDGDFQYENEDMKSFAHCKTDTLCSLINGFNQIIRSPQFSDDGKALMRGLVIAGYPWITRDENELICAFQREPTKGDTAWDSNFEYDDKIIPKEMLKQITWNDTKAFDAATYLESEAAK